MKHLELAYFNIYHYFQQRNREVFNQTARFGTMYLVALSAGGWILFLQAAFLRLIRGAWFSSPALSMTFALGVYVSMALIFYRIFIVNNYDEKIYDKYQYAQSDASGKRRAVFFSFLLVIMPYLLLFALKLFFPAQH